VAIGMIFGALLDLPLGFLTDRYGQRLAFCCALCCLMIYYFGLILVTTPTQLLFLEILVGVYSALLSGSFTSWFFNSWEIIVKNHEGSNYLIRNTMGNLNFVKMIAIFSLTLLGGYFLYEMHLSPHLIFLAQSLIALGGLIVSFYIMIDYKTENVDCLPKQKAANRNGKERMFRKIIPKNFHKVYFLVTPYFVSFAILSFTSLSFGTLVLPVIIYSIVSPGQILGEINFSSITIVLVSIASSLTDVVYGVSSRFSGKFTSFITSPLKGMIFFYSLNFPLVWLIFSILLTFNVNPSVQLFFILSIFIGKLIISGLTSGLHWHLYYEITLPKYRSTQESYLNTLYLLVSIFGFGILGFIMEESGLAESLFFLFISSVIGIFFLIIAKKPSLNTSTRNSK
jgi:MFS family permease